jgi:hypothetical protein
MPLSKTIEDEELGKIKFSKYKGAKYLKIKVNENADVSVSLPYQSRFEEARKFIEERRQWIREQILKFKSKKSQTSLLSVQENFRTKFRELELVPCDVSKPSYRLSPTKIKVYYPLDWGDDKLKTTVQEAIEAALRREAHVYLPQRLQELAQQHGLKYQRVFIRNTKTRWGSCSAQNNINLCIHLMKLPDKLIDYVLMHELTHTVHKNHSPKFWNLLTDFLGTDAKLLDKQLKIYRANIGDLL